jgi:putative lysine transport system permease protein
MIVQASFFWYGFGLFGNPFYCGLFVVSINTAAYIAEIIRGGIQSIDKGQTEAAYALGMNHIHTMIYVIIPQAIKNAFPAIGNEFIVNIKDTAVLSIIGIFELFNQGRKITGMHYRQLEVYFIVAVVYLFLTYTVSSILKKIEIRMDLQPLEITSSN